MWMDGQRRRVGPPAVQASGHTVARHPCRTACVDSHRRVRSTADRAAGAAAVRRLKSCWQDPRKCPAPAARGSSDEHCATSRGNHTNQIVVDEGGGLKQQDRMLARVRRHAEKSANLAARLAKSPRRGASAAAG